MHSEATTVDVPASVATSPENRSPSRDYEARAPAEREAETLATKTVRGTAWGVGGQALGMLLRLASNLTLTRILTPEIFGLMALINSVLIGLHMITDVGVNASIMRSPRGDEPRFLHTAYSIQVARGLLVSLCVLGLSFPMADFYDDPRLLGTIGMTAFTAVLYGFMSTRHPLAMRHMDVRRNTIIELSSQLLQLIANVVLALWLRSVWALVLGALVQAATLVALSHFYLPGARDRFGWDKSAAKELYDIAKWITLSSATAFLASRFDVMALGKLIPKAELGVYSQAVFVASIPYMLVLPLVDSVLLPAMSAQLRSDQGNFGPATRRSRKIVLRPLLVLVLGAALAAPGFYYLALDQRYHDAGWQAQLAICAVWFMCLSESASRILLAIGSARPMAVGNLVRFGGAVLGVLVGFRLAGLPGAVLGAALGPLVSHTVMLANLLRNDVKLFDIELGYSALCFALLALGAYLPRLIASHVGIPYQLVSIVTGLAILAPLAFWAYTRTRAALARS